MHRRVTVVCLCVCLSVCPSVPALVASLQSYIEQTWYNALSMIIHSFKLVDFAKTVLFKSYDIIYVCLPQAIRCHFLPLAINIDCYV